MYLISEIGKVVEDLLQKRAGWCGSAGLGLMYPVLKSDIVYVYVKNLRNIGAVMNT